MESKDNKPLNYFLDRIKITGNRYFLEFVEYLKIYNNCAIMYLSTTNFFEKLRRECRNFLWSGLKNRNQDERKLDFRLIGKGLKAAREAKVWTVLSYIYSFFAQIINDIRICIKPSTILTSKNKSCHVIISIAIL